MIPPQTHAISWQRRQAFASVKWIELAKAITRKSPANIARGRANLRQGSLSFSPDPLPSGSGDSPSNTRDIVAEQTDLKPRQVERLSAVKKEADKGNSPPPCSSRDHRWQRTAPPAPTGISPKPLKRDGLEKPLMDEIRAWG